MKKLTTLTAIGLSVLMLLSACTKKDKNTKNTRDNGRDVSSNASDDSNTPANTIDPAMLNGFFNDPVVIADNDGKELGTIYTCSSPMLTEKGVLYSAWPEGAKDDSIMEYHLFDQNTGEDRKLGQVTDPAYEDTNSRVEINGNVYSLAMFGDLLDADLDPIYLQKIDLVNGSISLCPIIQNGYPYQAMCRIGNKLLLFVHDQQSDGLLIDRIFEYDPETETANERMSFRYSENEQVKQGDTIRSLYSDGNLIYILRIHAENNDSKLLVDIYDMSYNKKEEKDITALFSQALKEYDPAADPAFDMYYQAARFFITEDGKLYYLNFSDLSFLADISKGTIERAVDPLFRASFGSGSPFFAIILKGGEFEVGSNHIFTLDNGELVDSTFDIFDADYYIESIEVSAQDIRVVYLRARSSGQEDSDHPGIYCILIK
ncbi:MAG: hypothetical protein J5379_04180 [Clostridiales bacterium]|nr:hypothetical protein [Clostridiales bacterium]